MLHMLQEDNQEKYKDVGEKTVTFDNGPTQHKQPTTVVQYIIETYIRGWLEKTKRKLDTFIN